MWSDHFRFTLSLKTIQTEKLLQQLRYRFVLILACFHFTMGLWAVPELIQFSGPFIWNFKSKEGPIISLMDLQSRWQYLKTTFAAYRTVCAHCAGPWPTCGWLLKGPREGKGPGMLLLVISSLFVINTSQPCLGALWNDLTTQFSLESRVLFLYCLSPF